MIHGFPYSLRSRAFAKAPTASFNELQINKNRLILETVYPEGKTLAESRWIGFEMNAEMVKPGIAGVYNRYGNLPEA
jgi:hypothetical protein